MSKHTKLRMKPGTQISDHWLGVHVVVQFCPWFKFHFPLCLGMIMYDNEFETMKNKI